MLEKGSQYKQHKNVTAVHLWKQPVNVTCQSAVHDFAE